MVDILDQVKNLLTEDDKWMTIDLDGGDAPTERQATVHEERKVPILAFVRELGITIETEEVTSVAHWSDSGRSFRCTLTRPIYGQGGKVKHKTFTETWSHGGGLGGPEMGLDKWHEMVVQDMLDSFRSDCNSAEEFETAEQMQREFGYEDKREAQKAFRGCKSAVRRMRDFLGGADSPDWATFLYGLEDR